MDSDGSVAGAIATEGSVSWSSTRASDSFAIATRRPRVLVADDDDDARDGLCKLLRGEGFEVEVAIDGESALRMASENDFDAVLTDVYMPATSGIEVCERLHARDPELPVILLAGRADVGAVVRAMRAGARDYLTKPIEWDAVLSSVLEAIDDRAHSFAQRPAPLVRGRLSDVARGIRTANERLVESSLRVRELATEAVRERTQLEALLANLEEGAIIAERGGRIRMLNGAARSILDAGDASIDSLAALDAYGLHTVEGALVPADDRPLARAFRGERFVDLELLRIRPNGERRRLLISGTHVQNERGEVDLAIVVLRDVTKLRELERQREELTALVSHDLRTPLASVRMLTWTIRHGLSHGADHAALAGLANRIERNVSNMNGMVEEILDASHLDAGTFEIARSVIDLRDLVTSGMERLDDERARRVVVVSDDASHLVFADGARLDRAITNLVTNALKYSPDDSVVEVQIRRERDAVEITVTDRGFGIAPEELDRLFDRHYRATSGRKKRGFGLGLYIAKQVVESHRGTIRVESALGEGTSFRLAIPAHEVKS